MEEGGKSMADKGGRSMEDDARSGRGGGGKEHEMRSNFREQVRIDGRGRTEES